MAEMHCKSVGSRVGLYFIVILILFATTDNDSDHDTIKQDLKQIKQAIEQYLVEPVTVEMEGRAGNYAIKSLRKDVGSDIRLDDSCDEKENAWFWIGKFDAFNEAMSIVNSIKWED